MMAVHGGADPEELSRLGLRVEDVLDFSASINPYGPSPRVREAVIGAVLDRYPDRAALALRQALADVLDVPVSRILAGNGSSELIWLTALAFIRPGDAVLVLGPTYSEYARAAALMGARLTTWNSRADNAFALAAEEVTTLIRQQQPRIVYVCNPNNPTGMALAPEVIAGWARSRPETLFVVDEAYHAFAPGLGSALTLSASNVLVLRSMTKDYALAGLRLGYAVGSAETIAALAHVCPPWSVSAAAQAAGVAALADGEHLRQSLAHLARAKAILTRDLERLGLSVVPSAVHFFLVRVGDGTACRQTLLRHGVVVRDAASFGLPEYVRIATRRPDENERLVQAMRGVPPVVRTVSAVADVCTVPPVADARTVPPVADAPGSPLGRTLMVQGTSSSVGKSLLVTALCRIFARRGVRVAPFKAQNMSNNAAVCLDGAEIGRAQALQAYAAGIEPSADMNPVLLKPEAAVRSQVIVLGRPWQTLPAGSYYRRKDELWSVVAASLERLRQRHELVLIEGAGSPVELNLRGTDIVNMALALHANSPVLLVGDIDRGGIFAQLLGTLGLLSDTERALVRGLVVNKFRGDRTLFADGVRIIEERGGVPVLGVVPHVPGLALPEEDAVALETAPGRPDGSAASVVDIAVIRLPHIANFDDFDPLQAEASVRLRYVTSATELGEPGAVIVPGTKSTMADLAWLRERGLADAIRARAARGAAVVGICGGYQMLGTILRDPGHVESALDELSGLGLLPVETEFAPLKETRRVQAQVLEGPGWLRGLASQSVSGYEIHMGRSRGGRPWLTMSATGPVRHDGAVRDDGRVWGCYLHGLFANDELRRAWLASLQATSACLPWNDRLQESLDLLADCVEKTLDMRRLERIIEEG